MKFPAYAAIIGSALLFTAAFAQAQERVPGQIKASRVVGNVSAVRAGETPIQVANGTTLSQGYTVITAVSSSVFLMFSNGSSISLAADSRLSVDEFLQDPFASAGVNLAPMAAEPTSSSTRLNLSYGELIGNVKELNARSEYEVSTPVGVAGIRGTTFRIIYRPAGDGTAFFSLSTGSGLVVWSGTTGTDIPVSAGSEVVLLVTMDQVTGEITNVQVQSRNLSAEAAAIIEEQVTAALSELDTTNFTTTGPPLQPSPVTVTPSQQEDQPPPPVPPSPRVTPTAGQDP